MLLQGLPPERTADGTERIAPDHPDDLLRLFLPSIRVLHSGGILDTITVREEMTGIITDPFGSLGDDAEFLFIPLHPFDGEPLFLEALPYPLDKIIVPDALESCIGRDDDHGIR